MKFINISYEALQAKFPDLTTVFDLLLKIYQQQELLPDQLKTFLSEITAHSAKIRDLLNNEKQIFTEIYAPYLENLSDADISEIKSKLTTGMFEHSKTECNTKVKEEIEKFRKRQLKTQLFNVWKEKTGTKNPREWSSRYRTPILCCVYDEEFEEAKKAFDTLNRSWSTEEEIKAALEFLQKTRLFEVINDESKRNVAFERYILGKYSTLLQNLEKVRDALEHLLVDAYDWFENPKVKSRVEQLAEAEYNAVGSDKALRKIEEMDDTKLKLYLKRLIKHDIHVGIEVIKNEVELTDANVNKYLSFCVNAPFFLVVGDEQYKGVRDKLSELGFIFVNVSGYCSDDDKLPDIDRLIEHLKADNVEAIGNRLVVVGLGEYLALRGDKIAKNVLLQLKDLNIGFKKVIILLRAVAPQIHYLQTDQRFDRRRFLILDNPNCDLSLTLVTPSVGLSALAGIKALFIELEKGKCGNCVVNTQVSLDESLFTIHKLNNAYEAIKFTVQGFNVPESCGSNKQWAELHKELTQNSGSLDAILEKNGFAGNLEADFYVRITGQEYRNWLYFIALKSNSNTLSNSYLRYVLDNTNRFEDFKRNVLNAIIDVPHTDKRFSTFYLERKRLVEKFPESDIADFVVNNRKNITESIYKLTDGTKTEREEIITWVADCRYIPCAFSLFKKV